MATNKESEGRLSCLLCKQVLTESNILDPEWRLHCDRCYISKKIEKHADWDANMKNLLISCEICTNSFKGKTGSVVHKCPRSEYGCDKCGQIMENEKQLNKHILIIHKKSLEVNKEKRLCYSEYRIKNYKIQKAKIHECNLCGRVFPRSDRLKYHILRIHFISPKSDVLKCFNNNKKPQIDYQCSTQERKEDSLKDDTSVKRVRKLFECDICKRSYDRASRLKHHLLQVHLEEAQEFIKKLYKCSLCTEAFAMFEELKRHRLSHQEKNGSEDAPLAQRSTSINELLNKAVNKRKKYSFICHICGKEFTQMYVLRNHIRIHKGIKPHQCPCCGKCFLESGNLKQHILTHTGEKPYLCDTCGAAFSQNSSLKQHKAAHSSEKPHLCTVCGTRFKLRGSLREHMVKHTGERRYQCNYCDKRFTVSKTLKNHLRTHTGERPYACKVCGQAFARDTSLKNHMNLHTGAKPYVCKICGKSYPQAAGLYGHNKYNHKDVFSLSNLQ